MPQVRIGMNKQAKAKQPVGTFKGYVVFESVIVGVYAPAHTYIKTHNTPTNNGLE